MRKGLSLWYCPKVSAEQAMLQKSLYHTIFEDLLESYHLPTMLDRVRSYTSISPPRSEPNCTSFPTTSWTALYNRASRSPSLKRGSCWISRGSVTEMSTASLDLDLPLTCESDSSSEIENGVEEFKMLLLFSWAVAAISLSFFFLFLCFWEGTLRLR